MRLSRKVLHSFTSSAITLVALAIGTTNGSATMIPIGAAGAVLNISNLTGSLVGVSNACINWGTPAACQTATGIPDSVSGSDSSVFTVGNTAQDTIKDLPAGVSTPLVDFETVQSPLAGGVVNFDLLSIQAPQGFPTCISSPVCSTGVFVLTQQSPSQIGIALTLNLEAYTGTSGTNYSAATAYQAVFTTQISGNLTAFGCTTNCSDTIANLLAFEQGGGQVTATWSAAESPIPEPMSLILFGTGLTVLAALGRRRRRA